MSFQQLLFAKYMNKAMLMWKKMVELSVFWKRNLPFEGRLWVSCLIQEFENQAYETKLTENTKKMLSACKTDFKEKVRSLKKVILEWETSLRQIQLTYLY